MTTQSHCVRFSRGGTPITIHKSEHHFGSIKQSHNNWQGPQDNYNLWLGVPNNLFNNKNNKLYGSHLSNTKSLDLALDNKNTHGFTNSEATRHFLLVQILHKNKTLAMDLIYFFIPDFKNNHYMHETLTCKCCHNNQYY